MDDDQVELEPVPRVGLSLAEAAAALGVSERILEQLEAEGRIRRMDFGAHHIRRYSIDELHNFARSGEAYPAPVDLDDRRRAREKRHDEEPADTDPTEGRPLGPRGAGGPGKPRLSSSPLPLRSVE